jgi:hypothetical protein
VCICECVCVSVCVREMLRERERSTVSLSSLGGQERNRGIEGQNEGSKLFLIKKIMFLSREPKLF